MSNPAFTIQPSSSKNISPNISPGTQASPPTTADYFAGPSNTTATSSRDFGGARLCSIPEVGNSRSAQIFDQNSASSQRSSAGSIISPVGSPLSPGEPGPYDSRRSSGASDFERPEGLSRKSSTASVTFRQPHNPSLPQGHQRKTDGHRIRASSPTPVKFKRHVGFDNLPAGDATKFNTSSLTLNVRHQGYQPGRRSRTFMVGVDEHAYSDYALRWLLENMVDDGDEVICVRVVEAPTRDKGYQDEAAKMMQRIQDKNTLNRAISIVLEYSVGKLHATFQQLIQIYHPSLLIVGTRGRSLGGIQGLVNTRNSFSKYCLQYSPVPVVVVRPDDKRKKKKEKRSGDPSRNTYSSILAVNQGVHEADIRNEQNWDEETKLSPDEEAHRVAAAIGLPAAFDPTIKPYSGPASDSQKGAVPSVSTPALNSTLRPTTSQRRGSTPPPLLSNNESGDDDSGPDDDDDDNEFDVVSGQQALGSQRDREQQAEQAQRERLHAMEVGEAAALLKSGAKITEDDDDDDGSPGTSSRRGSQSTQG